jgi:hypothetical protein
VSDYSIGLSLFFGTRAYGDTGPYKKANSSKNANEIDTIIGNLCFTNDGVCKPESPEI